MASINRNNYDDSKNQESIKLDKLILYNTEFETLICTTCKYAISTTSLKPHLNEFHKNIYTPTSYGKLLETIGYLPRIRNEKDIKFPEFNKYYFDYLLLENNCYSCNYCQYATTSYKWIKTH